jgi:putative cell wall-binding protein
VPQVRLVPRALTSAAVVASVVAAVTVGGTGAAWATGGSVTDPDDAKAPLDVSRVTYRDDPATISWTIDSYGAFADDDVTTCLLSMDGRDRQVSVAWDAGAQRLVADVETSTGRVVGPAHVVRTTSTSMRLSVRRGDVGDPPSYRWFLSCLSDADHDGRIEPGETDTVPGGSALATHDVSPAAGVDPVRRIAGADRYATAIAASRDAFPSSDSARAVVLAGADGFADALSGAPLAGARGGPVLLTDPAALPASVESDIDRVLPSGGRVYVLGGDDAVSPAVAGRLSSRGYAVRRIAGADRYATSVAVANELGHPATVVLADGSDFPDALSGGVAAARLHGAVLLTDGSTLPPSVRTELADHRPSTRYAVGAPAAGADPGATAIVGSDRYDTARRVAARFYTDPTTVVVASGVAFADAVVGASSATADGAPLLLTTPWSVPPSSFDWAVSEGASLGSAAVVGGVRAVTDDAVVGLLDAIN